jgi:hypothetical protein
MEVFRMRHWSTRIQSSLSFPFSLFVVAALTLQSGEDVVAQQRPSPTASSPATAAPRPATPAALSNADVIELVKAGFSDDLIAVRLKQAANKKFDLSTKGMVELKAAGVSERLFAIMFGGPDPGAAAASPTSPSSLPSPSPSPTPESTTTQRRDAGIYLRTGETYTPLEPTVFSGGKSGGVFTSGLTMGIKKAKWKAVVRTPRAGQRIQTTTPEFYFYFENRSSGLNGSIGSLFGASSPNEFVLARMQQGDDERQLIVGEFGVFGASSGTRSQDTIALAITRLEPGIYKVSPREPLPAGEYCFFYAAGASTFAASGTGKLFDFGVDESRGSR